MKIKEVISTILIIAMWIFSYFFNPYTNVKTKHYISNIKSKLNSVFVNIKNMKEESLTYDKDECNELAKKLVSKNVTLHRRLSFSGKSLGDEWNAGYFGSYIKGSCEGENINYYYYKTYSGASRDRCSREIDFSYSKQIISDNGDIIGTNSFEAQYTLKPIPDTISYTQGTNSMIEKTTMTLEVIDVKILSCSLIKGYIPDNDFV